MSESETVTDLSDVAAAASTHGLGVLGAFEVGPDGAAPEDAATLVMLGYDGPEMWAAFSRGREASDGAPHPMDRWTRRIGDGLAAELGAEALYPFGAPPRPFLRWAQRAEAVWSSPLGMLVSARRGLWASYRLALAFPERLTGAADSAVEAERPCESCADRPCLSACPVDAFAGGEYDVEACASHLRAPEGADCLTQGCRARRACPVGRAFTHEPAQAEFHMRAFLAARDA